MWINLVSLFVLIGEIKAIKPKINKILQKLLPKALPIIKSVESVWAENIVIINSGAEVPSATIVKPINISGIWNFVAKLLEPFTKYFAPITSNKKPKDIISRKKNIFASSFYN